MASWLYSPDHPKEATLQQKPETEVKSISLLDELNYNPHIRTSGLLSDKDYRIKVDSYTTRDREPSESVNWLWGYIGEEEGTTTFIELGTHTGWGMF
ncbi:MAG: hypothetical protein LUH15_05895 [Tannerellaceae bacterium]|nr:hypothetical protein [Tannerellaceae bacterium]